MIKYFLYLCATIISVYGAGEFSVLTYPKSSTFKGHDHIKQSLLSEVYSAVLGFTTEQDSNWQGMYLSDPFHLAKALVTVAIDGVADVGLVKGHHYPLKTDEDEHTTFDEMEKRIKLRQPNKDDEIIRIDLSQGLNSVSDVEILKGIKNVKPGKSINGVLKMSVDEDRFFMEELANMNAVIDKVDASTLKETELPKLFWFKLASLHALSDLHGENSTATKEAKQLLIEALVRLNVAFAKLYDGEVLINVVTSDASHTRRVRSVRADDPEDKWEALNLAKSYNDNYPVIFNIIFWFGIVMFFTLLAVSMFIGGMDPGRDSIIYRMTSTRMKKDN